MPDQNLSERLAALMQTALFTESPVSFGKRLPEVILRSALQAAGSAAASLFLIDETLQTVQLAAYISDEKFYTANVPMELPAAAAWVLQNREPLRLNCPDSESAFTSSGLEDPRYAAAGFIAVPLAVNDICFGVLEAVGKPGNTDFSETDVGLLTLAAKYAASVYRVCSAFEIYADTVRWFEADAAVSQGVEPFIAASSVMREKLALCKHLAASTVPVLIIGESGVGKATMAEQLHRQSCRAAHPFIRVNCFEPSEALLEIRLFGNGAATAGEPVHEVQCSCFDQAEDGTLFLSEVSALPLQLQKRLLVYLTQSEGSRRNIRLIASTSRDIDQLTRSGSFLGALYARLNVLPIYIPPLRQRKEDILALAKVFLQRFSRNIQKHVVSFSEDAQTALMNVEWKGNIRELKNTVEYACLNAQSPVIAVADLFPRYAASVFEYDTFGELKTAVDSFKRLYIRAVLDRNGGNQTAAASELKIQRTYLSRLMKELKIKNYTD